MVLMRNKKKYHQILPLFLKFCKYGTDAVNNPLILPDIDSRNRMHVFKGNDIMEHKKARLSNGVVCFIKRASSAVACSIDNC